MRVTKGIVSQLMALGLAGQELQATIEIIRRMDPVRPERSPGAMRTARWRKRKASGLMKVDRVERDVVNYDQLPPILKARRLELGLTCNQVDDLAGLQTGYIAKLENYTSGSDRKKNHRTMGAVTMPLVLEALGLRLSVRRVETLKHLKRGPAGGSA